MSTGGGIGVGNGGVFTEPAKIYRQGTEPPATNPATNSTTTWEPVIADVTPNLSVGRYTLFVSYQWSMDANSRDFMARLSLGGNFIGNPPGVGIDELHIQQPSAVLPSLAVGVFGFAQKMLIDIVSPGSVPLLLEFRSSMNGATASIANAYIELVQYTGL